MKTVQIVINYHAEDDSLGFNDAMELTEDELRAVVRHLSSIRIADIEYPAVVPMKDLHDLILRVCKRIKFELRT